MNDIGKQVQQLADDRKPSAVEEALLRSKSSTQRLLLPSPKPAGQPPRNSQYPVDQEDMKKWIPAMESDCFATGRPVFCEPGPTQNHILVSDRFFAQPNQQKNPASKGLPSTAPRDSSTLTEFIDLIEGKLHTKKSPRPCIRGKSPIKLVFKGANFGKKPMTSPMEVKEGTYSTKSGRVFQVTRGPNGSLRVKFENKTLAVSDFLILMRGESFCFEPAEEKKPEPYRPPAPQHRRTKTDSNLLDFTRQQLKTKTIKLNNLF